MLLNEDPDTLAAEIGHRGLEVLWPDVPKPGCYRGLHIQEILDLCLRRGYGLVQVQFLPRSGPRSHPQYWTLIYESPVERFLKHITGRPGLIYGQLRGSFHAYAWDGVMVYDPNGYIRTLESIDILEAYLLTTFSTPDVVI